MTAVETGVKSVLITEEEIKSAVKKCGEEISLKYSGKKVLLVGILKGSFVFISDLAREITIPCEIDFMAASSYGSSTVSSGSVNITRDIASDLSGYSVIIAEDILDSGNTLSKIKKILLERNPDSLEIIVLLDKPERRTADIEADKALFKIPDKFVVGYGLDFNEQYRNLKYIGEL
ncbi:MAG: hypoxanthine phosphoribosyltransferase [Oscillospiraceae bacterium]